MKLIHLSDLHFGTEKKELVHLLVDDIHKLKPDIVVISGDFTQRATKIEFAAARNFLNLLKDEKVLSVPGNHDITLFNPIRRFFKTYDRYKIYISPNLNPSYCQNNVAILGINSASPFRAKRGIVTQEQLNYINDFFKKQQSNMIKIVVMHHNLLRSERHKIIKNSEVIISTLAKCKVDVVLSGHLHYPHVEQIKRSHFNHKMYAITAGTPISKRVSNKEIFWLNFF